MARWLKLCCCLPVLALAPDLRADVTLQDETITGELTVPYGERLDLYGTIDFDNATINLYGDAYIHSPSVELTGTGSVVLHRSDGDWYGGTPPTTIGAGIEILGERDTLVSTRLINQGVIAAVPGGTTASGSFFVLSTLSSPSWATVNHNIIEARSGGNLLVRVGGLDNQGVLRVHPDGKLRLEDIGDTIDFASLGTVENLGGTVEMDFHLNNVGQVFQATGGDWAMLANNRTSVMGGTIETDVDTSFVVVPVSIGYNTYGTLLLDGVTINGNVRSETWSRARVENDLVLNGTWRTSSFNSLTLSADSELLGNGTFEFFNSSGGVRFEDEHTIVPASYAIRAVDGGSGLFTYVGEAAAPVIEFYAPITADGGSFNPGGNTSAVLHAPVELTNGGQLNLGTNAVGNFPTITNNTTITAEAGGIVSLLRYQTFVNNGSINVAGGRLLLDSTIENHGSITVSGGRVDVGDYTMSGAGNLSIDSSTVVVAEPQTLAQFLATPSTNSDFAINSNLNLDGQTLTVADTVGQRWAAWGGELKWGTVNSTEGFELVITPDPDSSYQFANFTLRDVTFNADVRVPQNSALHILGGVVGTGQWILDGGEIILGNQTLGTDLVFAPTVVDSITPNAGLVRIRSAIDNQGSTLLLPGGVNWLVETRQSDGIIGGRIETAPGAELQVQGANSTPLQWAHLRGVTLAGEMRVLKARSTAITIRDGFTLDNGVVRVGDDIGNQFSAAIAFVGEQTVDGVGEFIFSSPQPGITSYYISQIQFSSATGEDPGPVKIGPGITIRTGVGSGKVGGQFFSSSPLPVVNHGTWIAENGFSIEIDIADFDQQGLLRAEADSQFKFVKNGSNAGQWQLTGGTFDLGDTTQTNLPTGVVSGFGTIAASTGTFINEGLLSPGTDIGTIEFLGDFQQTASGILQMTVAGLTADVEHDRLLATNAQLAGNLSLELANGFVPQLGDSFVLMSATGSISGEFTTLSSTLASLPNDLRWAVEYTANNVVLEVLSRAAGDFDADGDVDGRDFLVWQRNPSVGELADWQANYGTSASAGPPRRIQSNLSSSVVSVPEPAASALCLACGLLVFSHKRH